MKRLALLTALFALALAPVAALSEPQWPGWMTVNVSGVPSHETVRVHVQYQTASGAVKFTQQLASVGRPARFPLGKAHNLLITASAEESHKSAHVRFATAPSSVDINLSH